MNFSKSILGCCFVATLFAAYPAQAQSGWTRAKGSLFSKLDFSHLESDHYYNPNGTQLTTSKFIQSNLNLYAEYGLTNRFTVISYLPLLRRNAFETTEAVYGLGDLRLELKYRLTKSSKWPISWSIAPEIPTGRSNAYAQNKNSPIEKINLPTGDGEFNVVTTLAASKSFGKTYVSAFGSYNFRTKYDGQAFRDLYFFGAEAGWNPIKKLWLNAKLRSQFSNGKSENPNLSFVRGDATTYTLASVEGFYKFNQNWGAVCSLLTGADFISPFSNIYIAPYFSVGVVYEK